MGEYAKLGSERIKIGTCENMYYLRADQIHLVRAERGNVNPASAEDQKVIRFRFPWPDEDSTKPGDFDRYDRGVAVAAEMPAEVEHYSVQFSAPAGYLVSLPCPEKSPSTPGLDTTVQLPGGGSVKVGRNGFAGRVQLVQQAYRDGLLVAICRCGGCGALFRLPTLKDAEPVIVGLRAEADQRERRDESGKWWHAVADRIAAGYAPAEAWEIVRDHHDKTAAR